MPEPKKQLPSHSASLRQLVVLSTVLVAVGEISCKAKPTAPTDAASMPQAPLAPMSLQVVPAVASMRLGDTVIFSVAVDLGGGVPPSGPMPSWSSTNPATIAVDVNGRATALAVGDATIEVAAHGQRATRSLRVVD